MNIYPLSEGSFTIDQTKKFVPFDTVSDNLEERSKGSLLVEIQPFVVVTKDEIILLDTGLGYTEPDGILQIHHNMARVGIDPLEVSKVLLTHLHKDHAGGIALDRPMLGERHLSFPNAVYYVQRMELEYAFRTGTSSYVPEELEILASSDKLVLLDGDGQISDGISYELSGGHCPYHQVFWIREGGSTVFFGGDETPQLQQMKTRFMAKYDHDGRKAMELRKKWWQEGKDWNFLFYHDIKIPTAVPE
jgi:glyoxylase-like metal-dependent hydrolase (beta-lactamase superfamily II)